MGGSKKIKVVVADSHRVFRSGIKDLFSNTKEIVVTGEAENGEELYYLYFALTPDVMLVDISMPVLSGIWAVKKIKERDKGAKAVFLSMFNRKEYIYSCVKAGGAGFISKNISKKELIEVIKNVYSGKLCFGDFDTNSFLQEINIGGHNCNLFDFIEHEKAINSLTERERTILNMVGEGLTSAQIADKLFLSRRTIECNRSRMFQKLNLQSLPQFIKFAIEYSILFRKD